MLPRLNRLQVYEGLESLEGLEFLEGLESLAGFEGTDVVCEMRRIVE
jgi:hypothetical protein